MSEHAEHTPGLRPCPFCGGPVTLQPSKGGSGALYVFKCADDSPCIGSGLGDYIVADNPEGMAKAVSTWNQRPIQDALVAALKSARATLVGVIALESEDEGPNGESLTCSDEITIIDAALAKAGAK